MEIVKRDLDKILRLADAICKLCSDEGLSPGETEKAIRAALIVAEERNTLDARNKFNGKRAVAAIEESQQRYIEKHGSLDGWNGLTDLFGGS